MKEKIQEKLSEIEQRKDVTVVSARDFGSVSWNLDSTESDRDVAFIFIQSPEDYYKLGNYIENIDRDIEIEGQEHTFMGWNLRRFMELLDNSNPTTIEYLNSNVSYYDSENKCILNGKWVPNPSEQQIKDSALVVTSRSKIDQQLEKLREHANKNFKPIALFYHYRSMAKSNFEKYIENNNDTTVKRYLYILRGICYARYVEKTHEMPPLDFPKFYENELRELREDGTIPFWIYHRLGLFMVKKRNAQGSDQVEDEELSAWIREELDQHLDNEKHDIRGINTDLLNQTMEEIL